MAKLRISSREVSLIKGLIDHKKFNDQQVLAIFSHLERNINSREIGWIRRGAKAMYQQTKTATLEDVDDFLNEYAKLEEVAERLGLYEISDNRLSIYYALDYARSAVSIFNNNTIQARSQICIILMVVAWTYLLHARFRALNIQPIHHDADGAPLIIDGKPKHWELMHCISKPEAGLAKGEVNNLRFLALIRNEIEHRSTEDINDQVQSKLQATVLNFVRFAREKFGRKFDISRDFSFAIQLQALKIKDTKRLRERTHGSKTVQAVSAEIEKEMTSAEFNDPDYAFRVYVVPKVVNNEKRSDQAVTFSPVGSSVEMAIKHVERPKYRMKDALKLLHDDGLENITAHKFITAWRENDLKNPGKGLAVQLGGQWFWYQEGVDEIRRILTA